MAREHGGGYCEDGGAEESRRVCWWLDDDWCDQDARLELEDPRPSDRRGRRRGARLTGNLGRARAA